LVKSLSDKIREAFFVWAIFLVQILASAQLGICIVLFRWLSVLFP